MRGPPLTLSLKKSSTVLPRREDRSYAARDAAGNRVVQGCWCYAITAKNGTVVRFTEGDAAATFDGDAYPPYPGMLGGTVAYGLDGQPSGIDLQFGVTDDTLITRSDVRDGLFDGGELDVWEYDQASPSDGRVHQFWGRVDDISAAERARLRSRPRASSRRAIKSSSSDIRRCVRGSSAIAAAASTRLISPTRRRSPRFQRIATR
jgi:hypothetical protein